MKKILLTLTLLSVGYATNIKASPPPIEIINAVSLNELLNNTKKKAFTITNVSLTDACFRYFDKVVRGMRIPGATINLTPEQIKTFLDQEQTLCTTGCLGLLPDQQTLNATGNSLIPEMTYTYVKKLDTSGFTLSGGMLSFTINFTIDKMTFFVRTYCKV